MPAYLARINRPITTSAEFSSRLLAAIGYTLQFGRIPQALYRVVLDDNTNALVYPYSRIQEVLDMAQKKPGKKRTPFGNVEFINYKFDKETKARFDEWFAAKGNTVVNAIFETLQGENKISCSYDSDNEVFIASMTGKDDSLNPNKCIVIRSAEWFRAMAAAAFVNVVIFDAEVWNVSGETDVV